MKIFGKKELSESELDSIARDSNPVSGACDRVFDAFRKAGLSPRAAVWATDARLEIMIEEFEKAKHNRDLHMARLAGHE